MGPELRLMWDESKSTVATGLRLMWDESKSTVGTGVRLVWDKRVLWGQGWD